ncbi:MAG TPA: HemK/PrmC family methyltransferase, partial [Thermoguttaceae bacterium]|nr:HemK/PrmC family methyltransferase [Thermoguttaceae bacterium]
MATAETWTVGRLLQWTTEYLRRHGSGSPRLDAELLLADAIGCARIELYTSFDRVASDEVRAKFRELVRRRAAGEPVAYLLGRKEFYSLSFRVTPDVLIPRPETELLVVALLDLVKDGAFDGPLEICDVGTGSGILAVCAAKYLPTARIWAVDRSPKALQV